MRADLMKRTVQQFVAAVASVLAAGCATWGPTWSELSGERYHRTIENRLAAIPIAIDSRRVFSPPYKVEPGSHTVVVQSPEHDGFRGTEAALVVLMEPCKRYYVNAQFRSPVGPEWSPVVDYVEDIAGCTRPLTAK